MDKVQNIVLYDWFTPSSKHFKLNLWELQVPHKHVFWQNYAADKIMYSYLGGINVLGITNLIMFTFIFILQTLSHTVTK